MKTKLLLAAGLAAVSMAGVTIHKANAVTDTGDITAEIIAAIALNCGTALLDFGVVAPSGAIGTVVVPPSGPASGAGGATLVSGGAAGVCTLGGDIGQTADITVVNATETVTSGANNMTVDNFLMTYDGSAASASLIGDTLTAVPSNLNVGGTLNVGINQAPGTYTGTFTIDVVYN